MTEKELDSFDYSRIKLRVTGDKFIRVDGVDVNYYAILTIDDNYNLWESGNGRNNIYTSSKKKAKRWVLEQIIKSGQPKLF